MRVGRGYGRSIVSSRPTIDELLGRIEEADREISDLRHELGERLADVRRGTAVFDRATREVVRSLRQLEEEVAGERREAAELVELALEAVLARRKELGIPRRRLLWLEPVVLPDSGVTVV